MNSKLFPDEDSCLKSFWELKERRVLFVHIVVQINLIGVISINHMIVNNVPLGSRYAVVL